MIKIPINYTSKEYFTGNEKPGPLRIPPANQVDKAFEQ